MEPVGQPDQRTFQALVYCCLHSGEHAEQTLRLSGSHADGEGGTMEIIHRCCCGLDVHARTVVACLIKNGRKEIRTYSALHLLFKLLQRSDKG